nr:MAG TPA: hypothetical protein [Caudoviricetes sp.]
MSQKCKPKNEKIKISSQKCLTMIWGCVMMNSSQK